MRKVHSIAALCGDGLRPELQALFDRLAVDPNSELFVRNDRMVQSVPDPAHLKADQRQGGANKVLYKNGTSLHLRIAALAQRVCYCPASRSVMTISRSVASMSVSRQARPLHGLTNSPASQPADVCIGSISTACFLRHAKLT
jgi:hypothetical protein